jgi:hypothetical protein
VPRLVIAVYRGCVALLIFVAIGVQLGDSVDLPGFSATNFFSFFTILSNLVGAAVLAVCAIRPDRAARGRFDSWRGAATTYLTITGLVYALLLRDVTEELGTVTPWVNTVVHVVAPVAIVVDWLANPPRRPVSLRRARWWLAFPLVFLAYSLVRGAAVDWYPYPFLDPDESGGWAGVTAYAIAIAVAFVAVIAGVAWSGNQQSARRRGVPAIGVD